MNVIVEKIKGQGISPGACVSAILLAFVSIVIIKVVLRVLDKGLKKSKIEKSLHTFIKTSVKIALYFLATMVVSEKLNIDTTSFITLFGALGLTVTLATQGLVSNIAGGVTGLITKPFVVGDFVEIGDVSGIVVDIGFVYTKINSGDNRIIFIPNSQVTGAKIINYTLKESRRVDIEVSASYEDDIDKVKSVINDVIKDNEMVLKDEPIVVRVKEYKDSGISYTVKVWAKNQNFWEVYFDLMEGIKKKFDREGISMPYNQLEVKIKNQ